MPFGDNVNHHPSQLIRIIIVCEQELKISITKQHLIVYSESDNCQFLWFRFCNVANFLIAGKQFLTRWQVMCGFPLVLTWQNIVNLPISSISHRPSSPWADSGAGNGSP